MDRLTTPTSASTPASTTKDTPEGATVGRAAVDVDAAERAVADLLRALGRNPDSPQFSLTPRRVVQNLRDLTTNETLELSRFENPGDYTEPIIMRDISFVSLCEHHLLPFRGMAHVGYVPGDEIVGLSALAQVVEHYAANFQIQERLTAQIAVYLSEEMGSRSVGVTIQAEHDCVATRGVRAAGASAVTQAFRGELADDPSFRALLGLAAQSVAPPARSTRRGSA